METFGYVSPAWLARRSAINALGENGDLTTVPPGAYKNIVKLVLLSRSSLLIITLTVIAELLAMTGCVYYPTGSEVYVGPPPVIGPSLDIGIYGSPAGYYYRDYPVFMYRNRPVYYYGGRRYYFQPRRYYWRRGYRYYY
jgi:hypothetical protein